MRFSQFDIHCRVCCIKQIRHAFCMQVVHSACKCMFNVLSVLPCLENKRIYSTMKTEDIEALRRQN